MLFLCVCSRPPSKDRHHPRPVQALFWCQTLVLLQDEVQPALRESRGQGLPVHLLKEKRCSRNLKTAGVNWNALYFLRAQNITEASHFFFLACRYRFCSKQESHLAEHQRIPSTQPRKRASLNTCIHQCLCSTSPESLTGLVKVPECTSASQRIAVFSPVPI